MADIHWPLSPLLSVTGRHGRGGSYPYYDAVWNDDPDHFAAEFGPAGVSVLFNVHVVSNSTSGSTWVRLSVEKLNTSNQPIETPAHGARSDGISEPKSHPPGLILAKFHLL